MLLHNKIFFGKKSLGFNDDNIYIKGVENIANCGTPIFLDSLVLRPVTKVFKLNDWAKVLYKI